MINMCLSLLDLVCDTCRDNADVIFDYYISNTLEEEKRKYDKWIDNLCTDCKRLLE